MSDFLYHYTTISNLALILKNRTLRLNPLNQMDDLQETKNKDIQNFGQFVYVSSWTDKEEEIIPMWKMYTTPQLGVRIGLPKNPFQIVDNETKGFRDPTEKEIRASQNKDTKGIFPIIQMEDMKNELKSILEDSIYYHQTTSEVEVGAYLSGGVDSSYVVSVAKPDKTFSVGFSYEGFDETDLAKDLSNLLEIKNYRKKISPDDFFDALPKVEWHTDEPHANLSTVPLYFLSELTRKEVKVCLSGEGSDEMFSGYNEYNDPTLLKIYLKIPLFFRKFIRNICKHLPHFPGRNTLILYGLPFNERYIGHGTFMEPEDANKILAKDLKNNEKISDVLEPVYSKIKKADEVTKKKFIDFHFWLPQDILLKADKMSMAHSIELRTPLMDIDVFNFAKTLPNKYLLKNKETKYLFRDISKDKIPNEWAKRRKCGFPVPFSKWIREEKYYKKVKTMFEKDYVIKFFDQKYILKLLEDHYQNKVNNGRKIYNIYCFLIWYEEYFIKR